jgi:hypothetical protein
MKNSNYILKKKLMFFFLWLKSPNLFGLLTCLFQKNQLQMVIKSNKIIGQFQIFITKTKT